MGYSELSNFAGLASAVMCMQVCCCGMIIARPCGLCFVTWVEGRIAAAGKGNSWGSRLPPEQRTRTPGVVDGQGDRRTHVGGGVKSAVE